MTRCPKCHYLRKPGDTHVHEGICPACGIAYRKWLEKQQAANKQDIQDSDGIGEHEDAGSNHSLAARLLATFTWVPEQVDPIAFWLRASLLAAVAAWAGWLVSHGIDWEIIGGSFMHNVNLAFHEFGHVLFSPFGTFMMFLGGSLFQILLPLVPLAVFSFQQQDNFSASLMLVWCGQNFIDVAPYIRDAEYRGLPLVGGGGEESHDWGNILTMLDAVDSCYALAKASFTIGILVMLAGFLWGAYILLLQYRVLRQ